MPIYVSDDIVLKDNTISTAQSNANVQIVPNGSGALQIDGINIAGNVITTNSSNANLELKANSSGVVFVNDSFKIGTGATVTTILDEDDLSSDSATSLATQQSIKAYVDAQITAEDLDFQGDTGGALSIDLDSEVLDIAGGTNINTAGSTNTLTVNLDTALTGLTSVQIDSINIQDNSITTDTNADLEISPGGTGIVKLNVIGSNDSSVINVRDGLDIDGTLSLNNGTTVNLILDEDDMSSNSATALATQQSIKEYVDSEITSGATLTVIDDSSSAVSVVIANDDLKIAGGNNITTTASGDSISVALDAAITGLTSVQIDSLNLQDNSITTDSNADLELTPGGTGIVKLNTIGSNDSSVINVRDGLDIDGTLSLNNGTTVNLILDEDDMSSNSATALATQQSVKAYVDAQLTASDLDFQGDAGGALSIDLDSETLDIAGGANITTTGSSNTLTVALDAALTGLTSVTVDSITISDNLITTNESNANLELDANSSGYVRVLGTGAFGIPVGTTGERPTAVAGQLRLNSTTSTFEGYDGTSWGSLAGSSEAEADTSNTTRVTLGQIGSSATIVDSFLVSAFQTVKYNYVVNDEINGEFQTGFIHLVHDSSDSYLSEYAITHTGSSAFATFTTDISGSTVRLKLTGTSTTNSITLFRTGLGDNSEADSSSTNTGLTLNADVDSAQESLDTTSASTYRGVQYFILASQTAGDGSTVGHECIKINAVHDGSTVYHTAFGRTSTTDADLMTYDVDINSGNIRLLGTGATANTSVKIYKIMIQDTEESATGDNVSVITNTDVDSAIENIDSWENSLTAGTTYQAAHYFNTVKAPAGVGGAEYQVSEIVVVADGGDNVFESEFGIVHSGNRQLISYSTDYNNTTARLRGVGATTDLVVNGYRVNMERKGLGVSAASVVLNTNDQSIAGLKRFSDPIMMTVGSDPSTVANNAHIYAKDESSSAEVFVRDEAGNVTKISPHNKQGEWEYYSRNTKTGKTVRVNMEEMIRDIEKLTGKTYIQNT